MDGPISAEVISLEADSVIKEALTLHETINCKNLVIKIPMTPEGLQVVKILSAEGIYTNVTLVFSAAQALLAAKAGATYASPFMGRLDDIGESGADVIAEIFSIHAIHTEIIAASARNPLHVTQAAKAGAHITTEPYKVLMQMTKHHLTDAGIAKFLEDWKSVAV